MRHRQIKGTISIDLSFVSNTSQEYQLCHPWFCIVKLLSIKSTCRMKSNVTMRSLEGVVLWTRFLGPGGQMSMTLHVYRPRRFQCTWSGVIRPSGCWVTACAESCPDERTDWRTNGRRLFHSHALFPSEMVGDINMLILLVVKTWKLLI